MPIAVCIFVDLASSYLAGTIRTLKDQVRIVQCGQASRALTEELTEVFAVCDRGVLVSWSSDPRDCAGPLESVRVARKAAAVEQIPISIAFPTGHLHNLRDWREIARQLNACVFGLSLHWRGETRSPTGAVDDWGDLVRILTASRSSRFTDPQLPSFTTIRSHPGLYLTGLRSINLPDPQLLAADAMDSSLEAHFYPSWSAAAIAAFSENEERPDLDGLRTAVGSNARLAERFGPSLLSEVGRRSRSLPEMAAEIERLNRDCSPDATAFLRALTFEIRGLDSASSRSAGASSHAAASALRLLSVHPFPLLQRFVDRNLKPATVLRDLSEEHRNGVDIVSREITREQRQQFDQLVHSIVDGEMLDPRSRVSILSAFGIDSSSVREVVFHRFMPEYLSSDRRDELLELSGRATVLCLARLGEE
jgi:hypothetical protein